MRLHLFFQGTKTFAYEVWEQLGWRAPDVVVLPVGNGTLLLGAYLGFGELLRAGAIQRMPRLIAVQAARCAPLARAFAGLPTQGPDQERADTVAQGIAIAKPVRGAQILSAVRETAGRFVTVEEAEILTALDEMGSRGFYIEPTSAATIAGLAKYAPEADPVETIVSVITGHGLKAPPKKRPQRARR